MLAVLVVALVGAIAGYRALGPRGLIAAVPGLLIFPLWQLHKYLTRFDPATGYFGLDKVKVLLGEVVLFTVLGAVLGWAWAKFNSRTEVAEGTEKN